MKKISTSDKIYIGQSKILNAGRGVYAKCDIKKDEIIEECPMIEVSEHDTANLNESLLVTYFFYFGEKKERLAIALGFGSIYNHNYQPNAKYEIRPTEKMMNFIALNDIKQNDEITFDYKSGNPKNPNPLWFE